MQAENCPDPNCLIDFELDGVSFLTIALSQYNGESWVQAAGTVVATDQSAVFTVDPECFGATNILITNVEFTYAGFM